MEAGRRTEITPDTFGPLRPTEEPYTPLQGAARAIGFTNIEPMGSGPSSPSGRRQLVEFKMERGALKKEQRRVNKSQDSEEEKARKRQLIFNELKRLATEQAERGRKSTK
jgi:hypothetical protein